MENIHRRTKLGDTLNETLDEMISRNMITTKIKEDILKAFDKVMLQIFKNIKTKAQLKADIFDYRNCDNVWTFKLTNAKLSGESENKDIQSLQIMALDYSKITNAENSDRQKKNVSKNSSKKNKKK